MKNRKNKFMKKILKYSGIALTAFVFSFVLYSCEAEKSGKTVVKEELSAFNIQDAVEEQFFVNNSIPEHTIDVSVDEGIVTLKGEVDNLLSRDLAVKTAEKTKGVRAVVNRLTVNPPEKDDNVLRENIREKIKNDPAAELKDVNVTVQDAVVTLEGVVESLYERELASKIVKGVDGVKAVENNLDVALSDERPEGEIKEDIMSAFNRDIWLAKDPLEVKVDNDVVYLSGVVGSSLEKNRAVEKASVTGVTEIVDTGLKVHGYTVEELMAQTKMIESRSDEEITTALNDALKKDPRTAAGNIEISIDNGTVTLRGTVDHILAKVAAEQDAENTFGVWDVRNHIKVRPPVEPAQTSLSQSIYKAIEDDPLLDNNRINFTVNNGRIRIYGEAESYYEVQRAYDVISRLAGVVSIDNDLTYNRDYDMNDRWSLKERVEEELFWNPLINVDDVTVKIAEDRTVILEGSVDTWYQWRMAMRETMEAGAADINNKLQVKYGPGFYEI